MSAPLAELAWRFAAFAAVLFALGAGPASLLPTSWPGRARVAAAPVLGLCLGACGCTTLEWLAPADRWYPALAVGAAVSAGLGAVRVRRQAGARPAGARRVRWTAGLLVVAELLAIAAATFLPVATALASHDSVGPMSYEVFDGPGYVANAEAAQTVSIHAASLERASSNYVQRWWRLDAASSNRLDYAPVVAAADALFGLDATQTYAADLLAVVAAGGLGVYAALTVVARRARRVAGVLGGAAFGGSFFLQLVFDGSQAALTGLAVLVPLLVLLVEAARRPARGTLAVLALVLGGLATLYPIFLFPVTVVLVGALALVAARAARERRATGRHRARRARHGPAEPSAARAWARRALAVLGGAAALDVVATVRDARSLSSIATGGGILSSFPAYHLGAGVVGSWLLQTRDLYGVAFGAQSPLADLLPALLVPAAVLVVALAPLRREPVAWLALGLVSVSVLLGAYEQVSHGCGYCEDRSMLSAVPPLVFLVFAGLGTAASGGRAVLVAAGGRTGGRARTLGVGVAGRLVVAVVAVAYLAVVAYGAANARSRYAAGSTYVTGAERALVDRLPPGSGPVELEGMGALPSSIAAEPYLYELLVARGDTVSAATAEEGAGLAEDWGPRPLRPPWFDPAYRYVLTRLGGVRLARRSRLAAAGDLTLERRAGTLGVTVEAGLGFSTAGSPLPSVTGPLRLVVTGAPEGPVALRLELSGAAGSRLDAARPGRAAAGGGTCTVLAGTAPLRTVAVQVPEGSVLRAVDVRAGGC